MRYSGLIFLLPALLLAAPSDANADADRLVGFGGFGSGFGGLHGELGKDFDSNIVRTSIHGGVRIDDLAISWNFDIGFLGSNNAELHGRDLFTMAFGPNVRYMLPWPNRVAQLYIRGGFHRVWWKGGDSVTRTCEQTGVCNAGFYQETPDYAGFAVRMGIGVQITPPLRRRRDPYLHFSFDLGYEMLNMKVIRDRQSGHMITAMIQIAFGGGRKGQRR